MSSESFETRFMRFIEDYVEDDNFVYLDQISSIYSGDVSCFNVNVTHTLSYDDDLGETLLHNSDADRVTMRGIVYQKLRLVNPEYAESIRDEIEVRLINLPELTAIHRINASYIDELVQIEGTVIQRGPPLVRATMIAYKCRECGYYDHVQQDEQYRKNPVGGCPSCEGNKWSRDYEKSTFIDYQEIVVQELMENTPPSLTPDKIKVTLTGGLIRSCEPGEDVIIVGVVKAYDESARSVSLELDCFLDADSLVNKTDSATILLTEEDKHQIQEYMHGPEHLNKVVESIAPTIYGMDEIKEALAYQQCEGQVKYIGDTRIRGQFHVLMAGPPGCGKSELGSFMVKTHPKGREAIGKGASGVGLTASVVKEGEQFVLKGGAMPLADNGFLFVDELDKMNDNDSGAMHPGLEKQKIKINKADISAELNTRCSMLAACNPIGGKWSEYGDPMYGLNDGKKGIPIPLLDRFALIFTIRPNTDDDVERLVVRHILNVTSSGSLDTPYSLDVLRKIFAYARTIQVETSELIRNRIEEIYMTLFKAGKVNDSLLITRRQPYDLVRIAEASARLHGRNVTTMDDATNAVRVLKASLFKSAIDEETRLVDMNKFYNQKGRPESKKTRYNSIREMIRGYVETYDCEGIKEAELHQLLKKAGIKTFEASGLLDEMIHLDPPMIYRSGGLIKLA